MSSPVFSCLLRSGVRYIGTSSRVFSKKDLADVKVASAKANRQVVKEPETIRDTEILVKKCCGLNKYVDQEDPDLKPDEEYPNWLWTIHTGPPRKYFQYDPNTKEYWWELHRRKEELKELPKAEKTFYIPPKQHELIFKSRILPDTLQKRS